MANELHCGIETCTAPSIEQDGLDVVEDHAAEARPDLEMDAETEREVVRHAAGSR